jgi:hypothetical protein
MPGSMLILTWVGIIFVIILHRATMLILTWVGIIFVKILHLAFDRCKIMTNIMPTHVRISIGPGIRELFRNYSNLI